MDSDEKREDPYSKYRPFKQFEVDAFKMTYESQISYSSQAFKLLSLANGGAALALLTFAGNKVAAKETPLDVTCPLILFALGLLFSILAFFASYFTQMFIKRYWSEYRRAEEDKPGGGNDGTVTAFADNHVRSFKLAFAFGLASIGCFVYAVYDAANIISG